LRSGEGKRKHFVWHCVEIKSFSLSSNLSCNTFFRLVSVVGDARPSSTVDFVAFDRINNGLSPITFKNDVTVSLIGNCFAKNK
jgi:hypothetical protein